MFVCICNAIRETDLRRAALCTQADVEGVYARMGKRPQCRQCLDDAEAIVVEEREMACRPHLQAA